MARTRQGTEFKLVDSTYGMAISRHTISLEMKPLEPAKTNGIEPEPIKTSFRSNPRPSVVIDSDKNSYGNKEFLMRFQNPSKTEVFRLTTEIGKRYGYAEYTECKGYYPKEKYFAPAEDVKMVGTLVEIKEGGFGDGGWRIDVFDNNGEKTEVKYSYEGRTCFVLVD